MERMKTWRAGEGELPGWVRAHSIQRASPNLSPLSGGKGPLRPFRNPALSLAATICLASNGSHLPCPCIQWVSSPLSHRQGLSVSVQRPPWLPDHLISSSLVPQAPIFSLFCGLLPPSPNPETSSMATGVQNP